MTGRRGSYPLPFLINAARTAPAPVLTRDFGGFQNGGAGNVTLTLPAGNPGQLLVAHIGYRDSPQFTAPAGWTIAYQASTADTSVAGTVGIMVAYKVRAPGETNPTFTRSGGANAVGWLISYEANVGSLSFGSFTQNNNAGAAANSASVGSLTSAGSKSLLTVTLMKSSSWSAPFAGLSAASLAAGGASGTLVPGSASPVGSAAWNNIFWMNRPIGTGICHLQNFDLLREGAGASGTISVSSIPNTSYHTVALDFGWLA